MWNKDIILRIDSTLKVEHVNLQIIIKLLETFNVDFNPLFLKAKERASPIGVYRVLLRNPVPFKVKQDFKSFKNLVLFLYVFTINPI